VLFITIIVIAIFPSSSVYASLDVDLTVTTDKTVYHLREPIYIYGNLTWQNGTLIQDGLVGLEVDDPSDEHIAARTLTTGTTPTESWQVEVTDVIPCDKNGYPKTEFEKGTMAYFNVSAKNNDPEVRHVLITITVYDGSQFCLGAVGPFNGQIKENSTFMEIACLPIPETASVGNATVYANAYSEWPKIGGKPYCPEKPKTFKIVNGDEGSSNPPEEQTFEGNYNTTFKLSSDARVGNYAIHVTAIYQGYPVANITTFEVTVLGDANGDGRVDGIDLGLFGMAWLATSGVDPNYDARCDFNEDGTVDGLDLGILGSYWGYPYS
jgi:hypothetical protein